MTQSHTQSFPTPSISSSELMGAIRCRCIGPPRGGRVVAVAGDPEDPMVFYFGACAGGVWKTLDGGTYWENVSDGFFRTSRRRGNHGVRGGSQRDLCRHG